MAIEPQPGKPPLVPPPPPTWGELAPDGEAASVVRFALADRMVSFLASELKRWEHVTGEPEALRIRADKEVIVVEGRELHAVRAALDLQRLCELRTNFERPKTRPGPHVQQITIELA